MFEESKIYTVFNVLMALQAPYSLSQEDSDELVLPAYLTMPNAPRLSVDGSKGIVTGVYDEAPECVHLTQEEAEELMQTKEWSLPEVK